MPKKTKPKTKPKKNKGTKKSTKKSGGRCWAGYKSTPGKKAFSKGSCMKKS